MDKAKQMEFLFEEGGIADDGMNRDPISGNEVPPGSLAEEVRDDIPAQLSEGEYVVPADVVRYYGVKFFEDLRGQAKAGLNQMEEDGRIGGEPISMDGGSELSPEEEAELQAMMGMAVGGFVTEQPTEATDPYMAQAQLYRAPAPVAIGNTMERRGFQEGGLTEADTQVQFDPSQFQAGFSFTRPTQRPETTNVTLYGPNGEIEVLVLPAQQARYNQLISQGYTTQQTTGTAVTPEATLEISGSEDGGTSDFTTFSGEPARDLSEMTTEELQSNLDGLRTMGRIGGALAVAVNPVFGLAARAALGSSVSNLVRELEARGVDMSDYREERGRDIFGGGLSMYDGLQDQPGSRSGVDFGDTWLGDMLGFDGRAGVQGPSLKESREGARRSFDTTATTTTATRRDDDSSMSSSISEAQQSRSKAVQEGRAEAAGAAEAGRVSKDIQSEKYSGKGFTGGRAQGGFVSRRNKNKK